MRTTFALDYDGTYTRNPDLWDTFISAAKSAGHRVLIVTCRRDTEENVADVKVAGCPVIFTCLQSKLRVCSERGTKIDVWIDDDPACVLHGK